MLIMQLAVMENANQTLFQ